MVVLNLATKKIGLMLASAVAGSMLPHQVSCPYETSHYKEQHRFPNAGVTIFSNETYHAVVAGRCGGAMRLVWRQDNQVLNEPALTVVYPHNVRGSGQALSHTRETVTHTTVTSHDTLRRLRSIRTRKPSRFIRFAWVYNRLKRRVAKLLSFRAIGKPFRKTERGTLVRDRVVREITFGDEWVRLKDRVFCALSCETIVCRSPWPHRNHPPEGYEITRTRSAEPIFVEGGRRVSIVRLYRNGELIDPLQAQSLLMIIPVPV